MLAYARISPQIIVLDIEMPEVGGLAIVQWLADVSSKAHIIVASAAPYGNADIRTVESRFGNLRERLSIATLAKPFRIAELRNALSLTPGLA